MNTLLYEVKDHVARITLNRPDAANALNLEMGRDLMHASIRASEDPAVRAVILTGAGKMFFGGGDLKSFAAQEERLRGHLKEVETPAIHAVRGHLVLDEHEQVKVLSHRTWNGQWRSVTLWKSAEHKILPAAMMEYLARLTELAQRRAPDAARALLARSEAVTATHGLLAAGPRQRGG